MRFFRSQYLLKLLMTAVLMVAFPVLVMARNFQKAMINRVVNNVFLYDNFTSDDPQRSVARKKDVIGPNQALRTGDNSRAELIFKDGTVVRIGQDAIFSFNPNQREVELGAGAALFQQKSSDAKTKIRTATATASLTGTTVLVEQKPNRYQRALVLEGEMEMSITNRPNSQRTLSAGEMIMMPNNARELPEPVKVELQGITQTSGLLNEFQEDDSEQDGGDEQDQQTIDNQAIEESVEEQEEQIEDGELERTNYVIGGDGSETDESLAETDESITVEATDQDLTEDEIIHVKLHNTNDVQFLTDGKDIQLEGDGSSTLDLNNTTEKFEIDTEDPNQTANISMDQLQAHAQDVSITSRASGQIKIGDVSLTAENIVQLHAAGDAGSIQFVDNAHLETSCCSSELIKLGAKTVQIKDGVEVTVKPANYGTFEIYADNKKYNIGTITDDSYGKFTVNGFGPTINEDTFENFTSSF